MEVCRLPSWAVLSGARISRTDDGFYTDADTCALDILYKVSAKETDICEEYSAIIQNVMTL